MSSYYTIELSRMSSHYKTDLAECPVTTKLIWLDSPVSTCPVLTIIQLLTRQHRTDSSRLSSHNTTELSSHYTKDVSRLSSNNTTELSSRYTKDVSRLSSHNTTELSSHYTKDVSRLSSHCCCCSLLYSAILRPRANSQSSCRMRF